MLHAISLGIVLFVVWLLLSGHYEPLLLAFGMGSCILVAAMAHRMDVADHEGHPVHLSWRALLYWPWLAVEVLKANLDVARRVLDPRLPISPTIITLPTSQKSELGRVIYANSITLTPGTVSIWIENSEITVHALSRDAAEGLAQGEMDRRVTIIEGGR